MNGPYHLYIGPREVENIYQDRYFISDFASALRAFDLTRRIAPEQRFIIVDTINKQWRDEETWHSSDEEPH